jgi:energy-coupling factor transporter ATP-binding protein EcfA2
LRKLLTNDVGFRWEHRRDAVPALNATTAVFTSGRASFICGKSGSGKTTLGLICAGLLKPFAGEIGYDPAFMSKNDVAMVFQFPETLFIEESVRKEFEAFHGDAAQAAADEWLSKFGIDSLRMPDLLPARLSAAEGRLIAIALQMSRDPECLILDEPTIGLDSHHRRRLVQCLLEWIHDERLLIIISHDTSLMKQLKGEATLMEQGRVCFQLDTEKLLRDEGLLLRFGLM